MIGRLLSFVSGVVVLYLKRLLNRQGLQYTTIDQ
jgi:hypothetical protein